MNEKRFEFYSDDYLIGVLDTVTGKTLNHFATIDKLNEQQATIDKLDQENADLLGARIKAQEEWEKCTDKLKAKILEQQSTIDQLNLAIDDLLSHTSCDEIKKENEQLRKELDYLKSSSAENQKVVQSNDDDFIKEVGGKLFFKI